MLYRGPVISGDPRAETSPTNGVAPQWAPSRPPAPRTPQKDAMGPTSDGPWGTAQMEKYVALTRLGTGLP